MIKLMRHQQSHGFIARIAEQVSHVGEWIDLIEFATFYQAAINRGGFARAFRTRK